MADSNRIKTPLWRIRERFAIRVLPVLGFLGTMVTVIVLWSWHGGSGRIIGRVEARRVNVTAGVDGVLVPLLDTSTGQLFPFDRVQQGQVVARLDDRSLQSLLEALRGDVAVLQRELAATQLEWSGEQYDREHEYRQEASNLAYREEMARLEVIDRHSELHEMQLELQRAESQLQYLRTGAENGLVSETEVAVAERERQLLAESVKSMELALQQARENYAAARQRRSELPSVPVSDVELMLAPIRDAIAAAEARVREAQYQLEALQIRSPVSGTVAAVYSHPGQGVRAGDWILTIAADDSDHIVGYVEAGTRVRIEPGTEVRVRIHQPGSPLHATIVEAVSSQWESLPLEMQIDQRPPPLVLPVKIRMPPGLNARPGEPVDIHVLPVSWQ